jgi:hypothetical protein
VFILAKPQFLVIVVAVDRDHPATVADEMITNVIHVLTRVLIPDHLVATDCKPTNNTWTHFTVVVFVEICQAEHLRPIMLLTVKLFSAVDQLGHINSVFDEVHCSWLTNLLQ